MRYDNEIGVFYFSGSEEDDAFRWMWTCLCDLTWRGRIETIWRIITKKPPERFFTDWEKVGLKENKIEHNKECPSLQNQPVCTCEKLRRYS